MTTNPPMPRHASIGGLSTTQGAATMSDSERFDLATLAFCIAGCAILIVVELIWRLM